MKPVIKVPGKTLNLASGGPLGLGGSVGQKTRCPSPAPRLPEVVGQLRRLCTQSFGFDYG